MIFQNPLSSLHPLYTVGWQIIEMIRAHEPVTARQARARAIELLGLVGIPHARIAAWMSIRTSSPAGCCSAR